MTDQEALKKSNGNVSAAARLLGISRDALRRRLGRKQGSPATESKGRTLAQFRQAHDKDTIVPAKIRAALKELGAAWLYELEFLKLAGIGSSDLNTYRQLFEQHVVVLRGDKKRVWAGTTALARQLKELV